MGCEESAKSILRGKEKGFFYEAVQIQIKQVSLEEEEKIQNNTYQIIMPMILLYIIHSLKCIYLSFSCVFSLKFYYFSLS